MAAAFAGGTRLLGGPATGRLAVSSASEYVECFGGAGYGAALPEPVDGPPWTDPAALGTLEPSELLASAVPEPGELAAYAGLDPASSGWEALAGSEDPAPAACPTTPPGCWSRRRRCGCRG